MSGSTEDFIRGMQAARIEGETREALIARGRKQERSAIASEVEARLCKATPDEPSEDESPAAAALAPLAAWLLGGEPSALEAVIAEQRREIAGKLRGRAEELAVDNEFSGSVTRVVRRYAVGELDRLADEIGEDDG